MLCTFRHFSLLQPSWLKVHGISNNVSEVARRMFSGTWPLTNQSTVPPKSSEQFQLLPEKEKTGNKEDGLFDQQVQDVQEWWASPRFKGIKRTYSAEDIVSKRGTLQQVYPSSTMALKLFNLIKAREATGQPIHTCASFIHQ